MACEGGMKMDEELRRNRKSGEQQDAKKINVNLRIFPVVEVQSETEGCPKASQKRE